MRSHRVFWGLVILGLIGCRAATVEEVPPPGEGSAASSALDSQGDLAGSPLGLTEPTESTDSSATDPVPSDPAADAQTPPPEETAAEDSSSTGQPEMERVKAEAGVGLKGQSLAEHEGVLVTPAKALFSAQQRLIYDAAVPKALQLYQATNGRYPETHEEFMDQVIKPNQIQLPPLPPGHKYVYDPETHELMVERPR